MRTIKRGDRGSEVQLAQNCLNGKGFACGIADGIFGVNTEAAAKAFQKAQGLTADGIIGSKTWLALLAKEEEHIVLLREWGFGDCLDSLGEKETVKQFQAAMGLGVDGIAGKKTLTALKGEKILPRIAEDDIVCQCGQAGKHYCNGYPRGKGVGAGVLLLAERIFRKVEATYPGTAFYVTSYATPANGGGIAGGYRCEKWNRERGGASGSQHKACFALDICGSHPNIAKSKIRDKIESVAMSMNTKGGVGYGAKQAGIVHIDTRGKKARWKYGN